MLRVIRYTAHETIDPPPGCASTPQVSYGLAVAWTLDDAEEALE